MKDAKGHGSNPRGGNANRATTALDMRAEMDRKRGQAPAAHTSGVAAIGKSPFAPSVLDVVRNNPGRTGEQFENRDEHYKINEPKK